MSTAGELLRDVEAAAPLLNHLPVGVTIADTAGRVLFMNRASVRIVGGDSAQGTAPEDWSQQYGLFQLDGTTPIPKEEYPIVRALRGEHAEDVDMLVHRPGDGDEVILSVSAQPLIDADGSLIGAIGVFKDVSELRRVQLLKEELAAFIVHDLKSPLTAILGTCDLIGLSHGNGDLLEDVDAIRGAAERINRMVLDLLDVQMAEGGALEVDREDVSLGELFGDVEKAARARIVERGHQIVVDPGSGLTIQADRELLFRVLMNLVDNCVKYGPREGRILLTGEPGDAAVVLAVEDEGPGVPRELRERIFERYSRAGAGERHRSRDSRGLGLRFCRVVASAHEGTIWVEDAEPVGARFCVRLPTLS